MFSRSTARALCLLPLVIFLTTIPAIQAAGPPTSFTSAMQGAAQARAVPLSLVEATAYVNTRWEWINTPAHDKGVGPMKIRPDQTAQASALSGHSPTQIFGDLSANLDAGAALLAHAHAGGLDLASWRQAVVATQGPVVASEIYNVLASGASRTTSTGETISLAPQGGAAGPASLAPSTGTTPATDYPGASWVPADPSNYSIADRSQDYPVDMIVIHDVEGSSATAIQDFQTPGFAASAHYVVGYDGQITQMVAEKDIAWHAGNWDYNTRAIGIEHAGFAYTQGLYTTAEYDASAALAASICERWGVPMDRTHVIGHYQVPDPNNPGLYGGADHHTDPGPYWDWTYYMAQAQTDAAALPSPPRMMPDPVAVNGLTSATVSWQAARTCRAAAAPITGYTIVAQPGNISVNVSAGTLSYTFQNLAPQTTYTFTVTAHNSYGDDSLTSNSATPGRCASMSLAMNPASPQKTGTTVQVTASASGCANPLYQFWILPPNSSTWQKMQPYSSNPTLSWRTAGDAPGTYSFSVWAQDSASSGNDSNSLGSWDTYTSTQYALGTAPCSSVNATAAPASSASVGTTVTLTATASGCPQPRFEFWILQPGSQTWLLAQPYSLTPTYTWPTSGQLTGTYSFSIWASDASSPGMHVTTLGNWDAYTPAQYTLNPVQCSSVSASASPSNSVLSGNSVKVSANANCPNPLYQFWLLAPGSTTWIIVRPYSTSPTWTWNTSAYAAGTYTVAVWARDASSPGANSGGLGSWDSLTSFTYRVTSIPCTSVAASFSPASSAAAGSNVTITATASGCPAPQYEFWILVPGSQTWQLARDYATSATLTWPTAGAAPGVYHFSIWARDSSSAGTNQTALGGWDAYVAPAYTLT